MAKVRLEPKADIYFVINYGNVGGKQPFAAAIKPHIALAKSCYSKDSYAAVVLTSKTWGVGWHKNSTGFQSEFFIGVFTPEVVL